MALTPKQQEELDRSYPSPERVQKIYETWEKGGEEALRQLFEREAQEARAEREKK